jgi:hypothetical protein
MIEIQLLIVKDLAPVLSTSLTKQIAAPTKATFTLATPFGGIGCACFLVLATLFDMAQIENNGPSCLGMSPKVAKANRIISISVRTALVNRFSLV